MKGHLSSMDVWVLTLLLPGWGWDLCSDETNVISPKPNIRLTPDHPVNSYLSVGNQGKKTRALYLSRFNFGGPIKCKSTFFPNSEIEQTQSNCSLSRLRPEPDYPAGTGAGTGIPVPVCRNRIWVCKFRFRFKEPELAF